MRLEAVIEELKPHKGEPYNWLIFHFSADYAQGEVTNTEEGELTWMTAEEIKHENLFPSVQLVVDNVFNPAAGTVFATVSYADTGKEHKQLADHSLHYCSL